MVTKDDLISVGAASLIFGFGIGLAASGDLVGFGISLTMACFIAVVGIHIHNNK